MFNIAPRVSSTYRDCKIPLLLVTMFGDFAQGQIADIVSYPPQACRCTASPYQVSTHKKAFQAPFNHHQLCCNLSHATRSMMQEHAYLMQLRFVQQCAGGLMFGWNALALALKGQDIYSTGCAAEREGGHLLLFFTLHLLHHPSQGCISQH